VGDAAGRGEGRLVTAQVRITREGAVLVLTLDNRDRRNALSRQMLRGLAGAVAAEIDESVRAAVLTGAGDTFSAGADLADLDGTLDDLAMDDAFEDAVKAIRRAPVPVIAAVEGPCMGGAVDLALACDMRVAAEDAFFEIPATRLGLLYNPRAVRRLRRTLPDATLARLLLAGQRIGAAEAIAAGLAAMVVPTGTAAPKACRIAEGAAGLVPRAVAATKRLIAELGEGVADMEKWEALRREILTSPERRRSLAAAKARLGLE